MFDAFLKFGGSKVGLQPPAKQSFQALGAPPSCIGAPEKATRTIAV